MEKNNITAFIQSLGGGGAQGVLVTVMNYYSTMGYKVTVVVESLRDDINSSRLDSSINIVSLYASSTKDAFSSMIRYIKNNDIDYAFAFSPELAVNLYLIKKITKRDFLVLGRCINTLSEEYNRSDSFFRRYVSKSLVKIFYQKIDRIIVQAENMGKDLVENFGVCQKKIKVINNPLAEKFEKILYDKTVVDKKRYLLYVGRLENQKGLPMLLEAFSKIEDHDIKLKLIGKGSLKQYLIDIAKKLEITSRIEFEDFTTEIEVYYKQAIATVLSSYYEGFPNVLIESIACGTPIVSYDLPSGPRDIILDGINGYLADYLNTESLAEMLNRAIKKEWDANEIKETATRFTRDNILEKYKEALLFVEDKL